MRIFPLATALVLTALCACSPAIPDSYAASVDAARAREAALSGGVASVPAPAQVTAAPLPPAAATSAASGSDDASYAARERAAAQAAVNANSGQAPLEASPSNPPPPSLDNPAISDENSFDAVASRQTIQSDAQRIAANQQRYQVIAPTALPERRGAQANIVAYALRTRHPRGTRLYRRVGLNLMARSERRCGGYASADLAQIEFLSEGGPGRDRLNLDPDGDGYACGWDPRPFRAAVGQG